MKNNQLISTQITQITQITRRFSQIFFLFLLCACTTSVDSFRLQTGDLLFQIGSGRMSNAISTVTFGENNENYTHAGIVLVENDTIFIIEAISEGVCKTLLDTFLLRSATL